MSFMGVMCPIFKTKKKTIFFSPLHCIFKRNCFWIYNFFCNMLFGRKWTAWMDGYLAIITYIIGQLYITGCIATYSILYCLVFLYRELCTTGHNSSRCKYVYIIITVRLSFAVHLLSEHQIINPHL